MTTTSTKRNFAGPYKALLSELAELIDWLWKEHDQSFVKAGDNKVYAFGGDGYVLVFDESQWDGMIELMAPNGAFTIKPTADADRRLPAVGLHADHLARRHRERVAGPRHQGGHAHRLRRQRHDAHGRGQLQGHAAGGRRALGARLLLRRHAHRLDQ